MRSGRRDEADAPERRKTLVGMLDTVDVDAKKTKAGVAAKPKPPFNLPRGVRNPYRQWALKGTSVFLVETGEGYNDPSNSFRELVLKRKALPVVLGGR